MLKNFADYVVFTIIDLAPGSRSGETLDFFVYDTLKIFLLLTTIIYIVAIIRTSFPPEKPNACSPTSGNTSATSWPR